MRVDCFTFAFLADVCVMKKKMLRDRISDGGRFHSKLKKDEARGGKLFASLAKESQNYMSIPYL